MNTQVNARTLAYKKSMDSCMAYMNIENFKLHCSLFLALKNMDKIFVLSVANIGCSMFDCHFSACLLLKHLLCSIFTFFQINWSVVFI